MWREPAEDERELGRVSLFRHLSKSELKPSGLWRLQDLHHFCCFSQSLFCILKKKNVNSIKFYCGPSKNFVWASQPLNLSLQSACKLEHFCSNHGNGCSITSQNPLTLVKMSSLGSILEALNIQQKIYLFRQWNTIACQEAEKSPFLLHEAKMIEEQSHAECFH